MPYLQSVGISSCLPVCCPSISFSIDPCSFSQKPLVFAISHIRGCVLASSSGQTTLVFCFFNRCLRAPPPCLVFPLAHLNILISVEFSLLSSFFFCGLTFRTVCHCWCDDCFEEFVFQFHGHLPITRYSDGLSQFKRTRT